MCYCVFGGACYENDSRKGDTDYAEDRWWPEPTDLAAVLKELLCNTPNLPSLQAPIYFDYGCNTTFDKFSSANFNFTFLDVCPVHIGDNVMIGPNVTLATPMHPMLPEKRNVRQRSVSPRFRPRTVFGIFGVCIAIMEAKAIEKRWSEWYLIIG